MLQKYTGFITIIFGMHSQHLWIRKILSHESVEAFENVYTTPTLEIQHIIFTCHNLQNKDNKKHELKPPYLTNLLIQITIISFYNLNKTSHAKT